MKGYIPKNEEEDILKAANYEKKFKKYENLPQPTITDLVTKIDLFPSTNSYEIFGKYILINQTEKPIDRVLINFNSNLKIKSASFTTSSESKKINQDVTEIHLKQPLQPKEKAYLKFKISYQWFPVNGHESFNAIVENGSFMRISRYYPTFGYQKDNEIEDEKKRQEFQLGKQTPLKKPEAPDVFEKDFINLD